MRTRLFLFALCFAASLSAQSVYYIKFPNDTLIQQCSDPTLATNGPLFYNPDGLPLATKSELINWLLPAPACFVFDRNWTVYNAATYDSTKPCVSVPNPRLVPFAIDPVNFPGPLVSPIADPGLPWSATESPLFWTDTVPTKFSTFWDPTANCYLYVQKLYGNDTILPNFLNCPAAPITFTDSTGNDPDFWNDPAFPGNVDLPEFPANIFVQGYDSCSGASVGYDYHLFLDLDQDGVQETEVSASTGLPAGMIRFGNADTPNFSGGELRAFDLRPVAPASRYHFGLQYRFDSSGVSAGGYVSWWYLQGGVPHFVPVQLPAGGHRIEWFAEDACGNKTSCTQEFTVSSIVPVSETLVDPAIPGLLPNMPNPFREQTLLRFYLPAPGPATLRLADAAGRIVWTQSGYFSAGTHAILLGGAELADAAGVFSLWMETGGVRVARQVIRLP